MPTIVSRNPAWALPERIVVDRRPTSVEKLATRLMARALSSRRTAGSRAIALLLLIPVAPLALISKSIGYAIWLANSLVLVLAAIGVWWWLLRYSPNIMDILKQDLRAFGQFLIQLT